MTEPRTVPFRETLFRWMLFVIAMITLPILALEVRRPWEELDGRIEAAQALAAGVSAGITDEDLARMNETALLLAREVHDEQEAEARAVAFAVWVELGRLVTEDELRARYASLESEAPPYPLVQRELEAWRQHFEAEPEGPARLDSFRRAQRALVRAVSAARASGLDIADLYITADPGPERGGLFQENLVFVLGGRPWADLNVFPGQTFNLIENDGLFWRASYLPALGGRPDSFGHNPLHDPVLPRFESDDWGDWFSAWYARGAPGGVVDSFTVDFEASRVLRLMVEVALVASTASLLTALVVVVVVRRLAAWIGRPVAALQRGAARVSAGDYQHLVPAEDGLGDFQPLIVAFNQMVLGLRERVNLMATLEKLLSKELAEAAASRGLTLGGRMADVTVLFTDFAGFSTLTRGMNAGEVVTALNDYFVELIPIIKRWGGFPDKYVGDGIVAVFGAPVPLDDHALRATRCAVELQRRMRALNQERRAAGKLVFEMRIGLNTGDVMVGAIGCDEKLEYTSIGETTNLASRMEALSPIGHIAIAEECHRRVAGQDLGGVRVLPAGRLEVRGYAEPVGTWHVLVDDLLVSKRPQPGPDGLYLYQTASTVSLGGHL